MKEGKAKKKGWWAAIRESMTRTGGCCGSGATCCGPDKESCREEAEGKDAKGSERDAKE
ncbi:MAG: hypothetical protein V1800_17125 [Candidatus Latescibacterota bacterium]